MIQWYLCWWSDALISLIMFNVGESLSFVPGYLLQGVWTATFELFDPICHPPMGTFLAAMSLPLVGCPSDTTKWGSLRITLLNSASAEPWDSGKGAQRNQIPNLLSKDELVLAISQWPMASQRFLHGALGRCILVTDSPTAVLFFFVLQGSWWFRLSPFGQGADFTAKHTLLHLQRRKKTQIKHLSRSLSKTFSRLLQT